MDPQRYQHLIDTASLRAGLIDRGAVADHERDLEVVERVRAFYRALKTQQVGAPSIYKPEGEWHVYIEQRRHLYQMILNGPLEGAAAVLRNFWRNELGPIVAQYAYYGELARGEATKIRRFMAAMSRDYVVWRAIVEGEPAELDVPEVGNPWGYLIDGRLIAPQALRFHNHARQIHHLVSDSEHPLVAEIGGGFGGMAWFLFRLGGGLTYLDLDLPETLVLAAYFLLRALPDKSILLCESMECLAAEDLRKYDIVLSPNYLIQRLPDGGVDLLLNAFSLSEMPYESIAEYIRQIQRCCRGYFLHNNVDREGVVNRGHVRTPGSRFPVDPAEFKLVYRKFDLFQGQDGDYREFLYERAAGRSR